MREIAKNVVADKLLKQFSYLSQKDKKRFKDYDNVTKLIVLSSLESMRRNYEAMTGEKKIESADDKIQLYRKADGYFAKEYIKKADYRYNKSLTK